MKKTLKKGQGSSLPVRGRTQTGVKGQVKKSMTIIFVLFLIFCIPRLLLARVGLYPATVAFAVEVAPRISDREIIEKLAKLEEGQNTLRVELKGDIKRLEEGQKALQQQINDLKESNNKRFDDMNSRFDDLRWMFSIFITISLVILGFVLRMQWQMHRRQTKVETTLETQKDELAFLKSLIEKLLPPRGVL